MEDAIARERLRGLGEEFMGGAAGKDANFEGAEDTVAMVRVDPERGFGV